MSGASIDPGEELLLRVDRVAHGGHCVARHEGRVVFVRHALPGELVRARITDGGEGARFLRADAVQVVEASSDRVVPPCPASGPGRCGGCDLQHVSPAAQRRWKAEVVAEQLERLAGLSDVPVEVEPTPSDPSPLGWRTRARFAVDELGRAGFRRHRSHDVVPLDDCPILDPRLDARALLARTYPPEGEVLVAVAAQPPAGEEVGSSVRILDRDGRTVEERGPAEVTSVAGGLALSGDAHGFWQVHREAGTVLVDAVLQALAPRTGDRVWDLYAGSGLFSLPLAEAVGPIGSLLAVEAHPGACAQAKANLADHPSAHVVHARVDRWLRTIGAGPDLVVLDPPRKGATRAVVEPLAQARPRRIAYVACDPAGLARDLAIFRTHGYRMTRLRAFDLFPMTHHVECLAVLEPDDSSAGA
jgi:tRNA/tmRNA/rRNA uracil-C5-methylase (TrmA/RlmC/RlmD family)